MKTQMIILAALLLMAGCVTTQGTWKPELDSLEPYTFKHSTGAQAAHDACVRMLLLNRWEIVADEDGIVNTRVRKLMDDECLSAFGLAGKSTGSLQLIIDDSTVVLKGNVWKGNTALNVNQGHPLMMKYRGALEAGGFHYFVFR